MRRDLAWVIVLLVVAALAVPAAAAPRAVGGGSIIGNVIDSKTGLPFDFATGGLIIVDVFNLTTMSRTSQFLDSPPSQYGLFPLPAGDYKMRFRYFDADTHLLRYRWYGDKPDFNTAATLHVVSGAALVTDFTLKPMRGAKVTGSLVEKGTGVPLPRGCYSFTFYEASGIGIGLILAPDAAGSWESYRKVPLGEWTVLATVATGEYDTDGDTIIDLDCGTSPAHLDTWYGGASGWPLRDVSTLVADPATFATADTFRVLAGVDVTGITVELPAAPLCRGKAPTIYGTTLADTISGTPGRDIISGLAGNDTINGRAGNDLMCGDTGNDAITGGLGADTAVGGLGTDNCRAELTFGCEPLP